MTLNTTELIARVRYPYGAFDQTHHDLANALESTVKEMHARELHHFEEEKLRAEAEAKLREAQAVIERHKRMEPKRAITKLREAEAVIESLEALLPKWRESRAYNAEVFTTGGIGMMREIDYHGDVERTLATYKPTNQEGSAP